MDLVLIKIGCPEWEYMWNWLSQHPLNEGLADPSSATHNGESWQYMGSYMQNDKVIHTFRHRDHPVTKTVAHLNLHASDTFTVDDVEKKFKI